MGAPEAAGSDCVFGPEMLNGVPVARRMRSSADRQQATKRSATGPVSPVFHRHFARLRLRSRVVPADGHL